MKSAELAFAKSPSTEWLWFCIELIIRFLYLLCSWIIAIFKECLNTNFIFFCLTRPQFVPTIYHTLGEHANHNATDVVPYFYFIFIIFLIKISYCELIIRFLYLLCSWIIAIFKECLNNSRNSQCLYRYQVTLIVLDSFLFSNNILKDNKKFWLKKSFGISFF
jgi:hypothetical protein